MPRSTRVGRRRPDDLGGVVRRLRPVRVVGLDQLDAPPIDDVRLAAVRPQDDQRRPARVGFQAENGLHGYPESGGCRSRNDKVFALNQSARVVPRRHVAQPDVAEHRAEKRDSVSDEHGTRA